MKPNPRTRREFLKTGTAGAVAFSVTVTASPEDHDVIDLEEATVEKLQAGMSKDQLTARQIAEVYLARIREIDPKLRSILEVNPDALAIANERDEERKRGKVRSAMHGIPVLLKDNIDTADRMKTTAGSLALVDAPVPEQDAFMVKRLRDAGAVLLGKTNLSEWANFRSTRSTSGWSARGGQTNNPYILDQNPCGSSAGTGVAVSANLCAVGIGTETNGSIICPATVNGIVGIKPTVGLISRSGIIPIAHTQDTAGPMTRTVADAAALLSIMAGADESDPTTMEIPNNARVTDYTAFLDKDGLRGARIGVARQFVSKKPGIAALFEAQFEVLRNAGAELIEIRFSDEVGKVGEHRLNVLLYEFKTDLTKYLAARRSRYRTLADLIQFNEEHKDQEMPLFGQELFTQAQAKGELTDAEYLDSLRKVRSAAREKGIDAVMASDSLDAIVAPSVGSSWSIAATAGYPYICVPAGMSEGLPVGMGFFGKAFSEPELIKYAYAFEQWTNARQKPKFLPKRG